VHATHAQPQEIDAVARSGAGVVLCPGTEANLGDGLADLPRWLAAGVPLALGSDSQVVRGWREELRWLEYGQRLTLRTRNVGSLSTSFFFCISYNSTKVLRWDAASSLGVPENCSFITRFNKAAFISHDSALVEGGAIGVLTKSSLLLLEKSHSLVFS
jgi:cytosine/adenosine deaminase-related metal-dependent hydrolase